MINVPFNDLSRFATEHADELERIIGRVVRSGRYILGKEVEKFEEEFARFVGVSHAIGVNSGTDALALALRALDVKVGDEVITVANTAPATISAIRLTNATPVFVDVDNTHTMDPNDLEKRITPKTMAVVPVHLYGFPADMQAIGRIAKTRDIAVLEDAAQAHGSKSGDRAVGNLGNIAAFSFYPTKNLGALGDAGAVVTNNEELAARVRRLRTYGEKARYELVEEGVNSRLDEMQAALLSYTLTVLPARNARRREIAEKYCASINNPAVTLPLQLKGERKGVWHLFVIEVDNRRRFIEHLTKAGIETAIHYPIPVYRQEAYSFLNVNPAEYPVTERVVSRVVSLPLFPEMKKEEIDAIIATVNSYTS